MAYFEPYIDLDGIHIPTYSDVLEYLTTSYRAIFGQDVYLGEETPDYQMMSVFAKCLDDYAALAVDAYNARNPMYAGGNSLDTLVELSGIIRREATASTAVLTLTGDEGTLIEAGSKAIDTNGNLWTLESDVTIPESGEASVNATCDTLGAIIAIAGAINGIYTPQLGWESVTNESAAEPGENVETDAELRDRFYQSHAVSTSGTRDSMINRLRNQAGVDFVSVLQNDTGSTDANGIPAHSICAIVEGGEDEDVANAIFATKSPGIGTYGTSSETIVDDQGLSNTVYFTRPTPVTVTVNISLTALSGYDADRVDSIIQTAISEDISKLGIGNGWNVTMAYKDIYSAFTDDIPFAITSLSATNTHGTSTSFMECGFDEMLTTDADHIVITLNT